MKMIDDDKIFKYVREKILGKECRITIHTLQKKKETSVYVMLGVKVPVCTKEFSMNRLAQEMKFRQAVFNYARLHGVTKASIKYHVNRQLIYRMKWRYDGTPESLMPKSRRPHHHPKQHTDEEISLIKNMREKYIMRKLGLYRDKNKNFISTRRLMSVQE